MMTATISAAWQRWVDVVRWEQFSAMRKLLSTASRNRCIILLEGYRRRILDALSEYCFRAWCQQTRLQENLTLQQAKTKLHKSAVHRYTYRTIFVLWAKLATSHMRKTLEKKNDSRVYEAVSLQKRLSTMQAAMRSAEQHHNQQRAQLHVRCRTLEANSDAAVIGETYLLPPANTFFCAIYIILPAIMV
jgi:hypothetical protein